MCFLSLSPLSLPKFCYVFSLSLSPFSSLSPSLFLMNILGIERKRKERERLKEREKREREREMLNRVTMALNKMLLDIILEKL